MNTADVRIGSTAGRFETPRLSSMFFWLSFIVAWLLFLDPWNPGYTVGTGNLRIPRDLGPVKYVGLAIGWIAFAFSVVGVLLNDPRMAGELRKAVARSWPIIFFGLFVFAGSMYARIEMDVKETFVSAAAAMTAYLVGLAYILEAREPLKAVQRYFFFLLIAVPFAAWHILDRWVQGGHAFHEETFMVLPLAVYCALNSKHHWMAFGWVLGFTALGIFSHKNTSYLVMLATLAYLFFLVISRKYLQRDGDSLKRVVVGYGMVMAVVVVGLLLMLVFVNFQDQLPTGSPEVRLYAYQTAWERFLESPWYGTAFTGTTNVAFNAFDLGGAVVTHSDFMDALSHGGLIGILLFIAAYITPFRLARIGAAPASPRWRAALHGLRAISIGGILVLLFNPLVLVVPVNAMFWLNTGLMAGLGWRCRETYRRMNTNNH